MAESGTSDPQAEALSSMMMPMLVLLGMMVLLSINEGIRQGLAMQQAQLSNLFFPMMENSSYSRYSSWDDYDGCEYYNQRGIHGSHSSAHLSHRSKEIRKQLMDARQSRDTARIEKMNRLQMEMTPRARR